VLCITLKLFAEYDLQECKSDSAFYSTSIDSIIRLYVKAGPSGLRPHEIIREYHQPADEKNKKFDNVEAFPNAFAVNIEKGDSTHFNQAAGKKMRGFSITSSNAFCLD